MLQEALNQFCEDQQKHREGQWNDIWYISWITQPTLSQVWLGNGLQLFYLLLLGGCYFAILYSSLHYIPGHYVSGLHRYSHWTPSNGDLLFLSFFECISFTWSFAIANEYVMTTH
jgi:hypothetical protein